MPLNKLLTIFTSKWFFLFIIFAVINFFAVNFFYWITTEVHNFYIERFSWSINTEIEFINSSIYQLILSLYIFAYIFFFLNIFWMFEIWHKMNNSSKMLSKFVNIYIFTTLGLFLYHIFVPTENFNLFIYFYYLLPIIPWIVWIFLWWDKIEEYQFDKSWKNQNYDNYQDWGSVPNYLSDNNSKPIIWGDDYYSNRNKDENQESLFKKILLWFFWAFIAIFWVIKSMFTNWDNKTQQINNSYWNNNWEEISLQNNNQDYNNNNWFQADEDMFNNFNEDELNKHILNEMWENDWIVVPTNDEFWINRNNQYQEDNYIIPSDEDGFYPIWKQEPPMIIAPSLEWENNPYNNKFEEFNEFNNNWGETTVENKDSGIIQDLNLDKIKFDNWKKELLAFEADWEVLDIDKVVDEDFVFFDFDDEVDEDIENSLEKELWIQTIDAPDNDINNNTLNTIWAGVIGWIAWSILNNNEPSSTLQPQINIEEQENEERKFYSKYYIKNIPISRSQDVEYLESLFNSI